MTVMVFKIFLKFSHVHVIGSLSVLDDSYFFKLSKQSVFVLITVLVYFDVDSLPVPCPDLTPPVHTVPGTSFHANDSRFSRKTEASQTVIRS